MFLKACLVVWRKERWAHMTPTDIHCAPTMGQACVRPRGQKEADTVPCSKHMSSPWLNARREGEKKQGRSKIVPGSQKASVPLAHQLGGGVRKLTWDGRWGGHGGRKHVGTESALRQDDVAVGAGHAWGDGSGSSGSKDEKWGCESHSEVSTKEARVAPQWEKGKAWVLGDTNYRERSQEREKVTRKRGKHIFPLHRLRKLRHQEVKNTAWVTRL